LSGRQASFGLPPFFVSGGFMSTLLDRIEPRSTNGRTGTDSTTPAERLRTTMAACRVQFTWFGTKKSLTAEQKAQAAEPFDAQGSSCPPARSCSTPGTTHSGP
jgi:hypothetical protein